MSLGRVERTPVVASGRAIPTDQLGYLLDPADWTPEIGQALADIEGVEMTEAHWTLVNLVRSEYEARQSVPEARVLLKRLAETLGPERATRRYLHQLFPYGYGPQVCKIAGMRMPLKVMLDV